MALVEITNIKIKLGNQLVVDDFSATLPPGTITAIIGPNGSGKSSLIGAIAGDLPLFAGSIAINGVAIKALSLKEAAAVRSVVLQNRNYWLSYSVREVVAMGQDPVAISRIDHIIDQLEMKEFADQRVTTLSGGQAQRVEIARALIRDSEIYLLDEPLSAQDSNSKDRIIRILQDMRAAGKTILIIAHSEARALTWCDQVFDLGS
ncbi:MAG: ATP-binding cassette domain-containing protein [Candidatus Planktophila sp.]|nr:ATP-binding cassette domain-containing protein [Candidatus Planktophila sp.]